MMSSGRLPLAAEPREAATGECERAWRSDSFPAVVTIDSPSAGAAESVQPRKIGAMGNACLPYFIAARTSHADPHTSEADNIAAVLAESTSRLRDLSVVQRPHFHHGATVTAIAYAHPPRPAADLAILHVRLHRSATRIERYPDCLAAVRTDHHRITVGRPVAERELSIELLVRQIITPERIVPLVRFIC